MKRTTRQFESFTKKIFKVWPLIYDSRFTQAVYFNAVYNRVIELIALHAKEELQRSVSVLDAGCGTGEVAARLAHRFPHISLTGVDFSPEMLARARKKSKELHNLQFQEANMRSLPFSDNSFDVIISTDVFHHLANVHEPLKELNRVAKPRCVFVLIDPAYDTAGQRLLMDHVIRPYDLPNKYYTQKELRDAIHEHTDFNVYDISVRRFTNFIVSKK